MAGALPLFWHQGLFLQPQHFQLADRSVQELFIPYQSFMVPHFWGVCRMEIVARPGAVPSLEILNGSFLFPDGTHAVFPGNATLAPRLVKDELLPGASPLTVYLGVRKWNDAAENVTIREPGAPLSGVATRFAARAEGTSCPDLHGGGPQGEVRQMSLVLQIFWETEIELLGDYLLIPVARLERGVEGVQVSRQFIPPCLTLGGSPELFRLVQEIRDQVASRCRRLEGCKKERGIQAAEFGSKDLVYLLALRTVNRYLAQLCHLLEARDVHPWQVYGVLRQLAAELSSFSETVSAAGEPDGDGAPLLPEYRHQDPAGCFGAAHDLVLTLLDQITAGPEYAIRLGYDGSFFSSEMAPAHLEGRRRYYLVLRTDEEPKEMVRSVAALAKLSSRERLPLLIAQALPGIALEHLPEPPRELPRSASSIFFSIDSRCEQWDLVRKWQNLALSWDQAPADLEVQVMIVARP